MDVRIASFNLNNLFSRFNWSGTVDPAEEGVTYLRRAADGTTTELQDVAFLVRRNGDDRRREFMGKLVNAKDPAMTGRVAARITALDADVLLVQEVEDQSALEDFNRTSLGGMYEQIVVLEGNDSRLIDVGIMVRGALALGAVTTWKHARHPDRPSDPVFSRDLLQAELVDASGDRVLTIYNTHLKSHFIDAFNRKEHRRKTAAEIEAERLAADVLRRQQAEVAAQIIASRMDEPVLLGGDMNDPPSSAAFAAWPQLGLVDVLATATESQPPPASSNPEDAPTSSIWSHRFAISGAPDHFELFDHLWASPALAQRAGTATIHRRRSWTRDGSDHDPVSVIATLT